jgi:C4-dicarboxylate-specific signal transduction histidine kinase
VTYKETVDYAIIWKLLIAMSAIVAVILFWNRKLTVEIGKRKEAESELKQHREHLEDLVDERTAELKQANDMLQHALGKRLCRKSRRSRASFPSVSSAKKFAMTKVTGSK